MFDLLFLWESNYTQVIVKLSSLEVLWKYSGSTLQKKSGTAANIYMYLHPSLFQLPGVIIYNSVWLPLFDVAGAGRGRSLIDTDTVRLRPTDLPPTVLQIVGLMS